jgi:dTDP-L-rhamnose 4-epimerase
MTATSDRLVLITGGAGFIGSRLARRLLEQGDHVVVADVLHPQVHQQAGWPADLPDDVEAHPVDVTSPRQCDALLRLCRPDVIVHLAAETGTGQSLLESSRHAEVNVLGTATLLDACSRVSHAPERFVLASSRAVYGEGRWVAQDGATAYALPRDAERLAADRWNPELEGSSSAAAAPLPHAAASTEPRPSNVYAATKLAQEHLLGAWCAAMGSALSILRLQNVYGPGQALGNPYTGVLVHFAQRVLAGEAIEVYEDGEIVRDFVFVQDVVSALCSAAAADAPRRLLADIGSGEPLTLLEVATSLARAGDAPEPAVSGAYRLGDVRAASADLTHAISTIGYAPSTSLIDGVDALLAWIEESTDRSARAL